MGVGRYRKKRVYAAPRRVALVVGVVALLADRHHAQAVIAQKPLERVLRYMSLLLTLSGHSSTVI